jgi:hypothetical protein
MSVDDERTTAAGNHLAPNQVRRVGAAKHGPLAQIRARNRERLASLDLWAEVWGPRARVKCRR